MNKAELIATIKEARGIVDEGPRKKSVDVRVIKKQVKQFRQKKEEVRETGDKKAINIMRRKISRLKKKTRRSA